MWERYHSLSRESKVKVDMYRSNIIISSPNRFSSHPSPFHPIKAKSSPPKKDNKKNSGYMIIGVYPSHPHRFDIRKIKITKTKKRTRKILESASQVFEVFPKVIVLRSQLSLFPRLFVPTK
jgi:hypothetical protein